MKLSQKLINLVKKSQSMLTKLVSNGKEINLTSDNTTIKSNNFNVDKNGNITANSATLNNVKIGITGSGNFFVGDKNGEQVGINPGQIVLYGSSSNGIIINSDSGGDSSIMIFGGYASTTISPSGVDSSSVENAKKNFEKFERALDVIKKIDIYKYNFKIESDTKKKHIGLVIGDNYNYSEEVTNNDNNGVDLYSFISVCCKAIQELIKKDEDKDKQILELTERLEKLEAIINEKN